VSIIGFGRGGLWRQATSLLVAYAFAVHVALFGFVAAQSASLAADQAVLGAALCLHDDGTAPSLPDQNSGGHCKLCTVAGAMLLAPPARAHLLAAASAKIAGSAADWFIPSFIAHASARPRAPPPTA
jgi:hypothetical protein